MQCRYLINLILLAVAGSGLGGCRPVVQFVETGHVSNLKRAEFSSDGRYLLTVSKDNEAILWDARIGRSLRVINEIGELQDRLVVEFCPDGSQALVNQRDPETGRTHFALHETVSGKKLQILKNSSGLAAYMAAFSRDGLYVCAFVTESQELPFRVWDVQTGNCVWSPEMPVPYDTNQLEALKSEIRAAGQPFDSTAVDTVTLLWFLRHVRKDGLQLTLTHPLPQYARMHGDFSPDGKAFLSRDEDSSDLIYNRATL